MILFPAIDLRRGRCVRLRQGDPDAETIYSDDPVAMARHWVTQGATWLHVVNLDGAFGATVLPGGLSPDMLDTLPINLQRLHAIHQAVDVPIQFGGGLRRLDDVALALALGCGRVVLGTAAVADPDLVRNAIERFGPERVVVGIDAREGRVATHGWQKTSTTDAIDLARSMAQAGVLRAVYTDIQRDGMLTGVNMPATVQLAERSGLKVIASGGVRGLDDITALRDYELAGVEGVIIGQALYTGALDLRQALALAATVGPVTQP